VANVGTSTVAYATAQTQGTTVFIAADGTALVLWCDGSTTGSVFAYAAAGYASWTKTAIVSGTYVLLAGRMRAGSDTVDAVSGAATTGRPNYRPFTKSGSTYALGSANVISTTSAGGTGATNIMTYCGIDPLGRHWILCNGTGLTTARALWSPANNPAGSWTQNASVTVTSFNTMPIGDIVGNYLVRCQFVSPNMQWTRLDVSVTPLVAWSTPATIPNQAGATDNTKIQVFKAISSTKGIFAYVGVTGGLYAQIYDATADTFGAATQLSSSTSDRAPTIVADGAGNAWVIWCAYVGTNNYALVYKKWDGSAWDTNPTTLVASGTNINYPHAGFGNNTVGVAYTQGTGSPYTVGWVTFATTTTLTRTMTATAALLLEKSRTVGDTAALLLEKNRTVTTVSTPLLQSRARAIGARYGSAYYGVSRYDNTPAAALAALRTVGATVSLTGSLQSTVPASAPLQITQTRTVPTTAALLAERTVPTTSALLQEKSRTAPSVTTPLLAERSRGVPETTAVLLTSARPGVVADAAILESRTRTAPATVALLALGTTRSAPETAALLLAKVRISTASAATFRTSIRTVAATSSLILSTSRTVGADVALSAARIIPAALSLVLEKGRTVTSTSVLIATGSRSADASVATSALGSTVSVPLEVSLFIEASRLLASVDTSLVLIGVLSVAGNVALVGEYTREVAADASIAGARVMDATATLTGTGTLLITADATLAPSGSASAVVPLSGALSALGRTRSITTASAALQASKARSAAASVPTSLSRTRTVSASVALRTVDRTRSIPATSALGAFGRTRIMGDDAAIARGNVRVITSLAVLIGTRSRNVIAVVPVNYESSSTRTITLTASFAPVSQSFIILETAAATITLETAAGTIILEGV
jgi:hypothetical protein